MTLQSLNGLPASAILYPWGVGAGFSGSQEALSII